ncbi:MAG: 2-keto-3-deoxygluconate permease [Suipraeoptans sp.]
MQFKIVNLFNKIPGGIMVIPLLVGALLNTFVPGALQIGGFTTGLLKEGTPALMGLFLICCGSSISIKQVGAPLYKGALLTVLKFAIGAGLGWAVSRAFGMDGIFGITPVVLIAVLTNSSGSIYATLAARFGDATDVGAVSVLSINDGPFLTMVALGATGMASIPFMTLLATILPIIIGFVWGNLDEDFKELCGKALPLVIIFLSFVLGSGMSFFTVIEAGLSGILLGLIVLLCSGLLVNLLYGLILRKKTAVGAAAGTAAGNSVATPAAIAAADPSFAPYADTATAQCSAACVMTAILCPVMVAFLDKIIKKKDAKLEQNLVQEGEV